MNEGRTVDWSAYANCIDIKTEVFFEASFEEEAESFCSACPVQLQCIQEDMDWGHSNSMPVAIGYRGISPEIRTKANYHRSRYNNFFLHDLKEALR